MMVPSRARLTDEQRRALAVRESSVALGAGAGCGKTTVLSERFLQAIDAQESRSIGRIVALTFTNKAARELRERIRKESRVRLETGGDPARWQPIIRGLVAARIETFHSFCGKVLRQHSIEAGVDPGFSVLDESIALAIRDEALASSLRERLSERDPDLIELAVEFGLGMVRRSIDDLLGNRSAGDIRDWVDKSPRELVDLWHSRWIGEVRPQLITSFIETNRPHLDFISSIEFDNAKIRERAAHLIDAFARFEASPAPESILGEISGMARVQDLPRKGSWPSEEIYEAIKGRYSEIRKQADNLLENLAWDEHTSFLAAAQGLHFARLALHARQKYEEAKRSRGGIDNDDLLLLTRDLLVNGPSSVRLSLSESFDLILVDEFQDTDPVQSEILEILAGPGIKDGRLFLVGDFKQSIYRFRGARPELFRDFRERFPADGRLNLTENFRSVPAILDFVNALFAESFPEVGEALRAGGDATSDPDDWPAVAMIWGQTSDDHPTPEKLDADQRRKEEARRIARYVGARLREGWIIRDKVSHQRRTATQGDVTFLFRSLSDAAAYESALVAEGLDYHVVGGSGFFAQQEVLDVINVLTAIEDPLDSVSMVGALRSPFFSISDDALYWIATEVLGSPYIGLERASGSWLDRLHEADRPRVVRARRQLAEWRADKDRLPIAVLVDRILHESGYEAALIGEFLGDRKRANARKLVRMARRFDESGGFTLADFVQRLRADLREATKETQAATTDEQGQVIRLMSIHQSKGLEFPIVVVPDLDRKRPGELKRVAFDAKLGPVVNPVVDSSPVAEGEVAEAGNSLGWTVYRHQERTEDEAEALRLLYVATTRARDSLILSSASDPDQAPTSPAMKLLDRRFDRRSGLIRQPLPEGFREPRIEIVDHREREGTGKSGNFRSRPRLLDVARAIREGSEHPQTSSRKPRPDPVLVDLDPSLGLPSTAGRLDRLIRSILADSRAFESGQLTRSADRSARLQDPVSPSSLVAEAVKRIGAWMTTPLASGIAPATEVHRSFRWMMGEIPGGGTTIFQGRADFIYREPSGGMALVILSDPLADEPTERLRLMLSVLAATRANLGTIRRAWRSGLGTVSLLENYDQFDEALIEESVRRWLHDRINEPADRE
ncbi:UvrD-helicase domain-containing protein [Tundrisphaera lichenicola]|uniref:UvrD-helicase domain-containing protein n=1 Tax=Tundrisphaera lichenicola TaxID=2029860 RepID=UPI003EBD16FE